MLGRLSWSAVPLDQPIIMGTCGTIAAVLLALFVLITAKGWWPYLWREWITSADHKRIGVMYMVLGLVMLLRGFADAIMMRAQLALAAGHALGYLPPEHYNQIFSAHGTIMIFFVAMPFVIGLMNFALPLQLGVRDVAFPVLNSVSFWLTAAGVALVNLSLFVGEFARTGWLAYPPLSELAYSPGVGVDYYLWSLQLSGVGTLLSGINLTTTILKLRAPGMGYLRMPIFCWTALASNLLIVAAFPVLTATFAMLLLDRYCAFHFFTNELGGNPMMYINLIWIWGHPEVYILILPAFGVFSEVVATFSGKPLFGYRSMVAATMGICVLSFMVWLHHFFTMGAGADVNGFFGIMTMVIAVPTGVKVFNWLFTMYGGRVRFTVPIYWTLGFIVTFVIGGMTGVLMAIPPADFVLHNSLFLIAHFHNVAIGGVVFGAMAGYTYWFPKAFGFKLNERLGKVIFWCWFIGFYLAFMPLYALGLMGATRRMQHYPDTHWQPLMLVALAGAVVILIGIALTAVQLAVSIRERRANRDDTGDPWNARTLEWSMPSPPPPWNFTVLPNVEQTDAYWEMKRKGVSRRALPVTFVNLHLPRNTPVGVFIAFFAVILGFALIWRIEWLAAVGLIGAVAVALRESWKTDREELVPAQHVAAFERAHGTPKRFLAPAGDFDELREIGHDRRHVRVETEGES
jgi:cytochrome o ubiquinol oxidase subunit 1